MTAALKLFFFKPSALHTSSGRGAQSGLFTSKNILGNCSRNVEKTKNCSEQGVWIILNNYSSDCKCNFLFLDQKKKRNKKVEIPHFAEDRNNMLKPQKFITNKQFSLNEGHERKVGASFSFVCHGPAIIFLLLQTVETMCGSEGGERDKWFEKRLVCLVVGCYGNLLVEKKLAEHTRPVLNFLTY